MECEFCVQILVLYPRQVYANISKSHIANWKHFWSRAFQFKPLHFPDCSYFWVWLFTE